ncbi:MAG TPA: hypothetical protein VI232_26490, partial [Reyranella sp.]
GARSKAATTTLKVRVSFPDMSSPLNPPPASIDRSISCRKSKEFWIIGARSPGQPEAVTDIALAVGYETCSAFTVAGRDWSGMILARITSSSRPKPSAARRSGGTFSKRFAASR